MEHADRAPTLGTQLTLATRERRTPETVGVGIIYALALEAPWVLHGIRGVEGAASWFTGMCRVWAVAGRAADRASAPDRVDARDTRPMRAGDGGCRDHPCACSWKRLGPFAGSGVPTGAASWFAGMCRVWVVAGRTSVRGNLVRGTRAPTGSWSRVPSGIRATEHVSDAGEVPSGAWSVEDPRWSADAIVRVSSGIREAQIRNTSLSRATGSPTMESSARALREAQVSRSPRHATVIWQSNSPTSGLRERMATGGNTGSWT